MPWAFAFYAFLCHVAVHEEYHRPAGAGVVGTEAAVIVAGGDALFNSPGDRFPIRRCDVGCIIEHTCVTRGLGTACGTPEEGHYLTSRAGIPGAELGGGIAAGYLLRLVVICPQDRIVIYAAFAYVNEGIIFYHGRCVIGILCSADGAYAVLVVVACCRNFLVGRIVAS